MVKAEAQQVLADHRALMLLAGFDTELRVEGRR